ncbi:hypothetical protein Q3G72_015441 [Acer saccharum]|nr:hypothetical protein Q3G72_015441 [Acer saccharum]
MLLLTTALAALFTLKRYIFGMQAQVPDNAKGGCLGLITNCSNLNQSENPIVAVEFDTYQNHWDPSDNHVGININSIQSKTRLTLDKSIKNWSRADASISYDSQTSNLSLFLTYGLDNPVFFEGYSSLSYEVNLSKVLPEWVSVGFSSATGADIEIHYILSWEFNSTELISGQDDQDANPPTNSNATPPTNVEILPNNIERGGANIGVVIGYVVGGLVLVSGIVLTLVFGWRKRSRQAEDQEGAAESDDHSMDNEFEHGMGPKRFYYGEVARSTNNFSEEGKLGEGGFGGVYKGFLSDLNLNVAVKRVSKRSKQGKKEYIAEAYGNEKLVDVADKKLGSDFDRSELECLMMVGLWCAHPDHNLRPSIRQALQVLNFELAMPNLPQQMPVPRFDLPTSSTSSTEPLLTSSTG